MTDLRSHESSPDDVEPATHTLSDADARVLDWLVEHGFDAAKVHELPAEDQPRAMALVRQMSTLDALSVPAPHESLVDAVIARIDHYEADRAAAMRIGSSGRPRFRMRLADVLGVAAMLMLSAAVLLPIASQMRASSLEAVCASNMRSLGAGLTSYASDNRGSMPALAGIGAIDALFGGPKVGAQASNQAAPKPQQLRGVIRPGADGKSAVFTPMPSEHRHSASLALLVSAGHCEANALQCPGCAKGAACFAYRVPAEGSRFMLDTTKPMVVVADANPVIELRLDGRKIESAVMSSRNHGDRGQNMLFNDGAVDWTISPVLTNQGPVKFDNIWLPRDTDGRERTELHGPPRDPNDNFVAQ